MFYLITNIEEDTGQVDQRIYAVDKEITVANPPFGGDLDDFWHTTWREIPNLGILGEWAGVMAEYWQRLS